MDTSIARWSILAIFPWIAPKDRNATQSRLYARYENTVNMKSAKPWMNIFRRCPTSRLLCASVRMDMNLPLEHTLIAMVTRLDASWYRCPSFQKSIDAKMDQWSSIPRRLPVCRVKERPISLAKIYSLLLRKKKERIWLVWIEMNVQRIPLMLRQWRKWEDRDDYDNERVIQITAGKNKGSWKEWMVPPKDNSSGYAFCYYNVSDRMNIRVKVIYSGPCQYVLQYNEIVLSRILDAILCEHRCEDCLLPDTDQS